MNSDFKSDDHQVHTPGPWKVIPPGHGHATGFQCVQYGTDDTYTSLEMLPADARLCAAAPDLLAAAKAVLEARSTRETVDATTLLIRAVRKAEGRS